MITSATFTASPPQTATGDCNAMKRVLPSGACLSRFSLSRAEGEEAGEQAGEQADDEDWGL